MSKGVNPSPFTLFTSTSLDSRIVRALSTWPFSTAANKAEKKNENILGGGVFIL